MSKKSKFELHEERLGTVDEHGHRVFMFPEEVRGIWRTRREYFYWFLILIYLVLPWIYVDGHQSILFNIADREFAFFSYKFYATNAPLLIFVLLGFFFIIGFITSIFGRVWCGWACPQTVFIDTIFRRIESFVEGKPKERKKLDESPWNFSKILKRSIKWFLFLVVSLHISHTFLGYFVGTHHLLSVSMGMPTQHMTLFFAMLIITAIVLLDFGWFREQFCIIACPYGRFQSVIMDENSMAVLYDEKRGEPRREAGMKKGDHADCINCYACVKACPTGIDIRRGVQLECIACTNCIDACDDIMLKVNKPTGLIRYDTESSMNGKKTKTFTPRNTIYLSIFIALMIGFSFTLSSSQELSTTVLRGPGSPFKVQDAQRTLNHFQLTLEQSGDKVDKEVSIEIMGLDKELFNVKMQRNPLRLKQNHKRVNIFVVFDNKLLVNGSRNFTFKIKDHSIKKEYIKEANLVGPIK